jgi:predicted RNA-binding Zn-ribbon protein involved in translation (DUF1610 family)
LLLDIFMGKSMGDYITMQCPNCGGKLNVGRNTLTLVCENCGTEHMVRRGTDGVILESYARCPVCNRNDKAEKVSAILRSQTQNVQSVAYEEHVHYEKVGSKMQPVTTKVAVPLETSQVSELARQLIPPGKPELKPLPDTMIRTKRYSIIFGIVSLLMGLGLGALGTFALASFLFSGKGVDEFGLIQVFGLCLLLLGPMLIGISAVLFFLVAPREKASIEAKKALVQKGVEEVEAENERNLEHWQNATQRWDKLYYCGRDDCVFMPGENTHAPVSSMMDYIYE